MNVAERIVHICKQKKIPVSKIERECGLYAGYISVRKKENRMMPATKLKTIADYLNVSVNSLLEDDSHGDETVIVKDGKTYYNFKCLEKDERMADIIMAMEYLTKRDIGIVYTLVMEMISES